MRDPIAEALPYDSEVADLQQPAWRATVHLLIPWFDKAGTPVDSDAAAADYVAETLRGEFLDWGYALRGDGTRLMPQRIAVCRPYVEGTFEPHPLAASAGGVPDDLHETFADGAHRLVRYRQAGGRLLRAELVDRSRCYTSGQWAKVEILAGDGTWSKVCDRQEIPTARVRPARNAADNLFDDVLGFAFLGALLNEAEQILTFA